MLALQITSTKSFMNQLLAGDTFQDFLLEEAVISTANTYTIDGHINHKFFSRDERENDQIPYEFQPWNKIQGLCFNLIKGRNTPLYFKFVLQLKPEKAASLLQAAGCCADISQLKALILNIRYDGAETLLTTGTAFHTFVMTKEPDAIWDNAMMDFLLQKGIDFEKL